ncbi:MAG: hypothetical protein LBT02_00395 [Rickettsiales bacterium]|jgi:lipopolysaccharide biosynthesis glycosyltransferase|nr:hypothetical protein [Rickettsiales bacterium]
MINIYYATIEKLIAETTVSMYSVLSHTKSFVNFYILETGVNDFDKNLVLKSLEKFKGQFKVEFINIPQEHLEKTFEGCNTWRGYLDAWTRFLFPFKEKTNIDKLIYLDNDTLVVDDINKLYNENLENYAVGGILDIGFPLEEMEENEKFLQLSKTDYYFNSGVLLINTKKWIEDDITNKLIMTGKKYGKKLKYPDQDALNIVFSTNKFKLLPLRYDMLDLVDKTKISEVHPNFTKNYIENEYKNPIIVHFVNKPSGYSIYKNTLLFGKNFGSDEFWYYAKKTEFYERMLMECNKSYQLLLLKTLLQMENKENATKNATKITTDVMFMLCVWSVLILAIIKKMLKK